MKQTFTFVLLLLVNLSSFGQGAANLDFENWTMNQFLGDQPDGFVMQFGTRNTADPQNGSSAVQLETASQQNPITQAIDTVPGTIIIGSLSPQFTLNQGEPFTERPDSLTGWVRYNILQGDTGILLLQITKWNADSSRPDVIGANLVFFAGSVPTWTRFAFPIEYFSNETPDSMMMAVASGGAGLFQGFSFGSVTPGSRLDADNFKFVTAGIDTTDTTGTDTTTVGLLPWRETATFDVYPNPSSDFVTVTIAGEEVIMISLVDLSGREIQQLQVTRSGKYDLDLSALTKGQYVIRLLDKKKNILGSENLLVH